MAELLGRIERLPSAPSGQHQSLDQLQANGGQEGEGVTFLFVSFQAGSGVPADVARIQDINRVINSNSDMSRIIQSYAYENRRLVFVAPSHVILDKC